jgi:arsenate reductase
MEAKEKITVYHNSRCMKSRNALAILDEKNIAYDFIEYLKTPLSATDIELLLKKLKLTALELMRKGEDEFKEHVQGKTLSETQLIATIVKYPKLLERPIVVRGDKAIIARPPERVLELL